MTLRQVGKFLANVEPQKTGCWVWRGRIDHKGYGVMSLYDEPLFKAHRIAYFIRHGNLDVSKELDHLCRNRACVNPGHLEQVTSKENLLRGNSIPAQNARKTHCSRGHELKGNNLIKYSLRLGSRKCKLCANITRNIRRKHVRLRQKQHP